MAAYSKKLGELEQKLQQGMAVSDAEIFEALAKKTVMTNTWHAAFLIATKIAPFCGYRPHLTQRLLLGLLDPLTMSGVGSAQEVIHWIQSHLNAPNPFMECHRSGLIGSKG